MQVVSTKIGEAVIRLSADDLAFVISAIGQALAEVEAWEFHTRTGRTPEQADAMLNELISIMRQTEEQQESD